MSEPTQDVSTGKPKEPSKDELEVFRMWSALSFAVMLIVVGIPLWWKTTEVYRATLPYSIIDALDPARVEIKTHVFVNAPFSERTNDIMSALKTNLTLFNVDVKPFKIDIEPITFERIENTKSIHPTTAGDILLVQVPSLPHRKKIYVSNNRIIYFTKEADLESLNNLLLDWFFEEESLIDKITSILTPQELKKGQNPSRLRSAPGYDVIFTIINSDPENVDFTWDVKTVATGYLEPLLDQISEIGRHHVKSQWLFLMELGVPPTRDSESGWNHFKFSQLPHIITPLEKKLGSGISKHPCVQLILYVAGCSERPLCFLSADELRVGGMLSPQWGAVQILNPTEENCHNHTALEFSSQEIMSVFISQFQALLGIKEKIGDGGVSIAPREGALLRSWELDSLFRMRAVEQIVSASLTLQSLSKLLGEISNIVINEEVAHSIQWAVTEVQKAREQLTAGQLSEALRSSSRAHSFAETAFSDPSLLALLYFPDDQKYAVYIPLFLPIMIPVIMSLKRIFVWITKGSRQAEQKSK